jgi:hypothetical protein
MSPILRLIIYKEIKKAIFDLKKGKSAGPDRILNKITPKQKHLLYIIATIKYRMFQNIHV